MTSLSYLLQLILSVRILAPPFGPAGEEDTVETMDDDAGDAKDRDVETGNCS